MLYTFVVAIQSLHSETFVRQLPATARQVVGNFAAMYIVK